MVADDTYAYDLTEVAADDRVEALASLRLVVPVRFKRKEPTPKQLEPKQSQVYRWNDAAGTLTRSETLHYDLRDVKFRCVHCGKMTSCNDGADFLPFGCSGCWSKAYAAIADLVG
mgnify:CR=1 FL=1